MIHIREEGENVQTGFNFYPKGSNQVGVVLKLSMFVVCVFDIISILSRLRSTVGVEG